MHFVRRGKVERFSERRRRVDVQELSRGQVLKRRGCGCSEWVQRLCTGSVFCFKWAHRQQLYKMWCRNVRHGCRPSLRSCWLYCVRFGSFSRPRGNDELRGLSSRTARCGVRIEERAKHILHELWNRQVLKRRGCGCSEWMQRLCTRSVFCFNWAHRQQLYNLWCRKVRHGCRPSLRSCWL